MGLLVFVHLEKAIHRHESIKVTKQHSGINSVSSAFFCTVCDYVLAKDADQPPSSQLSISVGIVLERNVPCLSFFHKEVVFLKNDRGPPVC